MSNEDFDTVTYCVRCRACIKKIDDLQDGSSNNIVLPDNMYQLENIVIYLVSNKADPNKFDVDGMTPLHFASIRGNLPVAIALTKHSNLNINVSV